MRVTEYFKIRRTQPTLDFLDVDVQGDIRVFLDPKALRLLPSEWGSECVAVVQDFFRYILDEIRAGHHENARRLLAHLREPNDVHLGLSRGRAQGRALGSETAHDVWEALSRSEAVETGLLEDLEDTILMVPLIGDDKVSDIAINLIRAPLIAYTQQQAAYHGIPLQEQVDSGPLWDPRRKEWYSEYVTLPVTETGRLILMPKAVVRRRMTYDLEEYYRGYILEHLREVELNANSELVELLRNGNRRVTKKSLEEKYGRGKLVVVRETLKSPGLLRDYRRDKEASIRPPLDHGALAEESHTAPPDWDGLLNAVLSLTPGRSDANRYEKAVEALLTALFYPALTSPRVQTPLHQGRKRVDITYTNMAQLGFFYWLSQHYTAPNLFVECKNYEGEIANPELDQLSGRFSPSRGRVGLLVCRSFDDKETFLQRCRDTAQDDRGFILVLDDRDLEQLVESVKVSEEPVRFDLLWERFNGLVM